MRSVVQKQIQALHYDVGETYAAGYVRCQGTMGFSLK